MSTVNRSSNAILGVLNRVAAGQLISNCRYSSASVDVAGSAPLLAPADVEALPTTLTADAVPFDEHLSRSPIYDQFDHDQAAAFVEARTQNNVSTLDEFFHYRGFQVTPAVSKKGGTTNRKPLPLFCCRLVLQFDNDNFVTGVKADPASLCQATSSADDQQLKAKKNDWQQRHKLPFIYIPAKTLEAATELTIGYNRGFAAMFGKIRNTAEQLKEFISIGAVWPNDYLALPDTSKCIFWVARQLLLPLGVKSYTPGEQ